MYSSTKVIPGLFSFLHSYSIYNFHYCACVHSFNIVILISQGSPLRKSASVGDWLVNSKPVVCKFVSANLSPPYFYCSCNFHVKRTCKLLEGVKQAIFSFKDVICLLTCTQFPEEHNIL